MNKQAKGAANGSNKNIIIFHSESILYLVNKSLSHTLIQSFISTHDLTRCATQFSNLSLHSISLPPSLPPSLLLFYTYFWYVSEEKSRHLQRDGHGTHLHTVRDGQAGCDPLPKKLGELQRDLIRVGQVFVYKGSQFPLALSW